MNKVSFIKITEPTITNFDIITPRSLFIKWKEEEEETETFLAVLSTCDKNNIPSSCTIYIKDFDSIFKNTGRFLFFSSHFSGKCLNMINNPNVSLLFRWKNRQVIIKAKATLQIPSENKKIWDMKEDKNKTIAWESYLNKSIDKELCFNPDNFLYIPMVPFWGAVILEPYEFDFSEETNYKRRITAHYFINNMGIFELSTKKRIYKACSFF
jgi:pyridoxine/pyridoxamine 5'-phosphate oxidase